MGHAVLAHKALARHGGCKLVNSDNRLPEIAKHVIMVATMLGTSRLFNPTVLRWAWVGIICCISLVLFLDVALFLL